MGSYSSSVNQAFDGPVSIVQLPMLAMWGKRGYSDGSTPYTWLCSIVLLPWLPGFPPPAFPTMIFLTSPQSISLQSTVAFTLWLLHNPWTAAPSHCTFQGTLIPVGVMYGGDKDFLILIPFRLSQISCFTPSLKCFSFDSDSCPDVGGWTPGSVPHLQRAGPVLLTLLFFPRFLHPTEFCIILYILFHWSVPLLRSQLVFCMYFCMWRCIPDVPVERDVLHTHLLLRHLSLFSLQFSWRDL